MNTVPVISPEQATAWRQDLIHALNQGDVAAEAQTPLVTTFEQVMAKDWTVTLSAEDLLRVASLCSEVAHDLNGCHANYWNNAVGETESTHGPTLTACMCQVADVIYNNNALAGDLDEAFEVFMDQPHVSEDTIETVWAVLRRVKLKHRPA